MAANSWPLGKVTDGARWDAEDLFGRLAIVADAAFLYAGFLPCGAPETTPCSLSRRYSVPELAHCIGADTAVLCLSRRCRRRGGGVGGGGKIVVDAYVDSNGRQRSAIRERLPLAALAPVLSRGVDDAARALMWSPEHDAAANGAWLWKLLADWLCRGLFLYICRHNGVPVEPRFTCLPVDVQMTILQLLDAADDVARVECASKELRRLVAEHDAVLWKAKYEAIRSENSRYSGYERRDSESRPPFFTDEDMPWMSWKEKYAMGRWQRTVVQTRQVPPWMPRVPPGKNARLQRIIDMVRQRMPRDWRNYSDRSDQPRTVARTNYRGWRSMDDSSDRRRVMAPAVQSNLYRKGTGAGAVHSPSCRNRWKHR